MSEAKQGGVNICIALNLSRVVGCLTCTVCIAQLGWGLYTLVHCKEG
jgi:hypothetical protein